MGADEQSSPSRKRGRDEEELADGCAAGKRPREEGSEGASLLGLASYEDDEEAARGHTNGRRVEEEDEEEDARRAPERRPRQVELRRDCPYLDTVNRQVLDFDFEKFCSISLSNLNVYACLVCGKYFQGRGLKSHAYTHSLEAGHHVFINLQTEKAYCLPDGYEINDPSLEDIQHVLNPRFTREQVLNLDKNKQWSRALDGSNYLPGMVGLNNIKETDFVNVTIQSLMRVTPLRNFFLIPENYQHSKSPLVHRFGELTHKIWHARNFKGQVSPHEFLQAVMKASSKRFQIGVQSDPVEFVSWLLNTLHAKLKSSKKKNKSIIHDCLQGELEVVKEVHRKHIMEMKEDCKKQNGEVVSEVGTADGVVTETSKVPFLMLGLDLPPPPLFKDAMEKNIIPQMLNHLGFGKKGKKNSGSSLSTSQPSTGSDQTGLFQSTIESTRRRRELLEYVAEQGGSLEHRGGSTAVSRVETRVLDRCPTYEELYREEAVQGRDFEQGRGLEQGGGSAAGSRVEALEQSPSSEGGNEGDDENEEEVDDPERDARLVRAAELAELGRPDRCPFRLRRHLLCNPIRSIDERTIIRPKGTRCWIEPGWSGKGHRRVINTELGNAIRFCFPGMVLVEGQRKAAHSWDHYALKPYSKGTCQDKVWEMFWGSFRLEEGTSEAYASFVFQNAARRRTKDSFSDARIKAVTVYYKTALLQPMTNKVAAKIHLHKEEYLQSSVDWICADMEAWQWLCEYWASDEFKNKSNRNRRNRKSKPGKHFYGPDGYVRMEQRMTAETGMPPTFFELYLKGHRGRDPNHPEQLCDEASTQKLTKYVECFKKTHGDDADYVKEPLDVAAAYEAGGGLPHGRLGLGDGYVERGAYARRGSSSISSSRSESNAEGELREELRRNKEEMREMRQMNMQMQQQMAYMLQLFSQGRIGSQFDASRNSFASSSQGSESVQGYIPPAQGFLLMLGATPPAWPLYPYPPYPGFLPPSVGPVYEPLTTHATTDSHQVTPKGCDDFLNLNDNMGASGGGASGESSHNMCAD